MSERYRLIEGDCLEVLKSLPDGSVDAVITDPPYGLSFMGKRWDASVPSVEVWQECLRVAKPGAHLLSFAGTRTQHRMAVAIEDAGWFIRDMIAWVYGSGFPKSHNLEGDWQGWGTALKPSAEPLTWATKPLNVVPHDVMMQAEQAIGGVLCLSLSNAKHAASLLMSSPPAPSGASVSARILAAMLHGQSSDERSGVTAMFKSPETARTILSIAESWSFILGASCSRQSTFTTSMATRLTTALKTFASLISQSMREAIAEEGTRRLGEALSACTAGSNSSALDHTSKNETSAHELATLLAGLRFAANAEASFAVAVRIANTVLQDAITSLDESISPSLEPITLARKPLDGTVAENVLAHGTGALNVDGCRVTGEPSPSVQRRMSAAPGVSVGATGWTTPARPESYNDQRPGEQLGRWPANLIHDGSDEVADRLSDAARFFYCAKASKADRDEGLDALPPMRTGAMTATADGSMLTGSGNERTTTRRNVHPTVKPTDLMRYLCRLVTPPSGVVLDPFMGSGSTGKAAMLEGLRFVGIELEPEYMEIARRRIEREAAQKTLDFGGLA